MTPCIPFDADTHSRIDAPAAREARNGAVLAAQEAFAALIGAERRCTELRRAARGGPEDAEIVRIQAGLDAARRAWPIALHALETDLQAERRALASAGSMAALARAAAVAGGIDTRGD